MKEPLPIACKDLETFHVPSLVSCQMTKVRKLQASHHLGAINGPKVKAKHTRVKERFSNTATGNENSKKDESNTDHESREEDCNLQHTTVN